MKLTNAKWENESGRMRVGASFLFPPNDARRPSGQKILRNPSIVGDKEVAEGFAGGYASICLFII